ncbi:MAG: monofunctional biosynthetic peptidoglycan transglycosylase [Thermoanaerobaculia bacterium]|nr:monofunctional biosynthetic peptidoglycan transglycosylase [Thermoanaerobaculia bacterium]
MGQRGGAAGRTLWPRRALIVVLLLLLGSATLFAAYQWWTWPDVAALAGGGPVTSAFIERHRGVTGGRTEHQWVAYGAISDSLKQAVLVSEDIGFFDHEGFVLEEIGAAVRETLKEGRRLRGASTLTQQLAKNLWLSPSRNPWRKVKEAILTVQLERHLEKRRILELYLNVAQFGPGVFGAEAAARRYSGRPASRLDARQAAELAAALPRPSAWNPASADPAYRRRVAMIERRMERAGWILRQL